MPFLSLLRTIRRPRSSRSLWTTLGMFDVRFFRRNITVFFVQSMASFWFVWLHSAEVGGALRMSLLRYHEAWSFNNRYWRDVVCDVGILMMLSSVQSGTETTTVRFTLFFTLPNSKGARGSGAMFFLLVLQTTLSSRALIKVNATFAREKT